MNIVRIWGPDDKYIGGSIWIACDGQGMFVDDNDWLYCYADHEVARLVM